ncbi:MAG: TetR/AcrR family transcriptional regulator [Flavobacteriales bacterium]|nr:TetR/AcrR family transcriptional regulator [Flavobacteriales bacterium]MCB9190505.1 TetR/AcrR family transcriptional regulator [Flavobacteriales bacterium]
MEEKAQNIIDQAIQLFTQYGVKSLTMDDLARHMGVSKKTLYQVVTDKADLVSRTIQHYIDQDVCELEKVHEESENAIEEMFMIAQRVSEHLKQMHPSILYDLEKYYPKAFKTFQEYKVKDIQGCVARNIRDGIEQGLYRDNINIPIVAGLYIGRMDLIFDQQLFPSSKYSPKDVYFEAIRYHIRGIASEKGIEYLKDKFKTIDTQNPIF